MTEEQKSISQTPKQSLGMKILALSARPLGFFFGFFFGYSFVH